jgi:hypothetical protein
LRTTLARLLWKLVQPAKGGVAFPYVHSDPVAAGMTVPSLLLLRDMLCQVRCAAPSLRVATSAA